MKWIWITLVTIGLTSPSTKNFDNTRAMKEYPIILAFGNVELDAVLYDNATAHDLISRMPFSITLDDYAGMEKIFYPDEKLSTEGAPSGYDPSVGDITYYAPWGDVAIFYKDFGHAKGLISLGKLADGAIAQLRQAGDQSVAFRRKEAN